MPVVFFPLRGGGRVSTTQKHPRSELIFMQYDEHIPCFPLPFAGIFPFEGPVCGVLEDTELGGLDLEEPGFLAGELAQLPEDDDAEPDEESLSEPPLCSKSDDSSGS